MLVNLVRFAYSVSQKFEIIKGLRQMSENRARLSNRFKYTNVFVVPRESFIKRIWANLLNVDKRRKVQLLLLFTMHKASQTIYGIIL